MKLLEIAKNGQKIAENSQKLPKRPEIAITVYWIVILTSLCLRPPKVVAGVIMFSPTEGAHGRSHYVFMLSVRSSVRLSVRP